jgi:hypothetical protein
MTLHALDKIWFKLTFLRDMYLNIIKGAKEHSYRNKTRVFILVSCRERRK